MEESQNQQTKSMLPGAIVVAALLIAGALVYSTGEKNLPLPAPANSGNPPVAQLESSDPTGGAVLLGDPNAKVTLVEFGDYQCPYCGKFFTDVEPQIREQYIKTGKAKMYFRNFPFLGDESQLAAEAASCAADQSRFWMYHDALYKAENVDGRENNGNLTPAFLKSLAPKVGMDQAKFDVCFDSHKYKAQVQKDYDDGVAAAVRGTPTTFVNGKPVIGALPFSQFRMEIETALAQAK